MHSQNVFQNHVITGNGNLKDVSAFFWAKLLQTAYSALDKIPDEEIDKSLILDTLPALVTF